VIGLVVFVAGALLVAGLLAAVVLLGLLWGVRALWMRLTGRPATPWSMPLDPRAGWRTVYRSTARWTAPGKNTQHTSVDVTDVVPREIH
jgi:hypothetical protein